MKKLSFLAISLLLFFQISAQDQCDTCSVFNKKPLRKWVFKHTAKKLERQITEGKRIYIFTNDHTGEPKKWKGQLANITTDSLFLGDGRTPPTGFSKNEITEIQIPKKGQKSRNVGGTILILAAVLAGIVLVVFLALLLLLIISISAFGLSTDEEEEELRKKSNLGFRLILLMLAGALALFKGFEPKTIKKPFSGDWEIFQPTVPMQPPVGNIP